MNLNDLFAAPVEVVVATQAMSHAPLLGAEERAVAGAVEKRRREYASGRAAARLALDRLGYGTPAIPTAADRSPIWPKGAVGSITHCDGFCAAAVAHAAKVRAIGLDAEPHRALPAEVVDLICSRREAGSAERALASIHWSCALFSAKEAFYKGFYPATGQYLDFHDVVVDFTTTSQGRGVYRAALRQADGRWSDLVAGFAGRWALAGEVLVCGATFAAGPGPGAPGAVV